jgi:hypothetical protein
MNMLTHNRAYSFYPVSTFIDRETVVCGPTNEKGLEALDKYKRRGWTIVHGIRSENIQCAADELKMRTRWVGDNRCWVIDLDEPKGNMDRSDFHYSKNISWRIRLTKYAKTDKFVPKMEIK